MAWLLLFLASAFEVGWAIGLKSSEGFSRPWPSAATVVCMMISLSLLALSPRTLPLGTAYAIWTGIGAVGTVVAWILLFGDSAQPAKLLCVSLIVFGVVGLKVTTLDAPEAREASTTGKR